MPRLEDGEFALSANKFKKRRAWITPDTVLPTVASADIKPPAVDIAFHKQALNETRPQQEYNKTVTRVEHDYNKSVTRLEQKKSRNEAVKKSSKPRVEHDYNKSVTRLEHDYNKTITNFKINDFYAFVIQQRVAIFDYEDEPKATLLSLSDVQRQVFWHVGIECIKRNSLHTGPIEIKGFFANLDISTGVVRTTLNRLVEKRLIQREKGKLGKNGFAIIGLSKKMFDAAKEIFSEFQELKVGKL